MLFREMICEYPFLCDMRLLAIGGVWVLLRSLSGRARLCLVGPGSPLGCIYGMAASPLVRVEVYPN